MAASTVLQAVSYHYGHGGVQFLVAGGDFLRGTRQQKHRIMVF